MKIFKGSVFLSLAIVLILGLSACAHTIKRKSLMSVSIGMSKEQIINKLGEPTIFRGSMINKYGQVVEVFEYEVDTGKDSRQVVSEVLFTFSTLGFGAPILASKGRVVAFWFYFHDDKLVQWGRAGDWQRAADAIHEIRFR